MPPGYRLELVASEPLIQDPIAIDWDPSGRLWAIELPGYMRDIKASGEYDPIGRIVVLEDANGGWRHGSPHGVRRRADPAAGDEGARAGCARGRAAEYLADARHGWGFAQRSKGADQPPGTGAGRPTSR